MYIPPPYVYFKFDMSHNAMLCVFTNLHGLRYVFNFLTDVLGMENNQRYVEDGRAYEEKIKASERNILV